MRARFCIAPILLMAAAPLPQQDMSRVEIQTVEVAEGVYMLVGEGGNIGLSVGDDGTFIVDDQFAPLTDKIKAAIAGVTDGEVKFVVNTHWHGDHTGGNESFGEAGAIIVAHRNVRKRMNPQQFAEVMGRSEQAPEAALPIVTFTDEVDFYWNGDRIRVEHVDPAHTDGDSMIWFTAANVVHMGDNFFAGTYPFIDVDSGGHVDGMIAAAGRVLDGAGSATRIIPGHGPLSGIEDLRAFRDMLVTVRDRVRALVNDGKSLDAVRAASPTADYDEAWGGGWMTPDRFLETVYRSLSGS